MPPKISVVTIVYNWKDAIEATIKNVLEQRYDQLEYIVIDGGSTDGTVEIIRKYADRLAYFISEKDEGISDAFNKGVAAATGDWVYFLNTGDFFAHNKVLQEFAAAEVNYPGYDVLYGSILLKDKDGRLFRRFGSPSGISKLKHEMLVPHQGSFFNRAFFNTVGGFDKSFKLAMDYELLLRKKDLRIAYIDFVVADMLAGGLSQRNVKNVYLEFRRAKSMHLQLPALRITLEYYWIRLRYNTVKAIKKVVNNIFFIGNARNG